MTVRFPTKALKFLKGRRDLLKALKVRTRCWATFTSIIIGDWTHKLMMAIISHDISIKRGKKGILEKSSEGSKYVWCSMFVYSKPKMACLSSIIKTCSSLFNVCKMKFKWCSISFCSKPKFEFNLQKTMFKFVQCSIKWCSTHH